MRDCTTIIAIGANLPHPDQKSPLETCRWAVGRLAALPGLNLVACSRWYGSAPVPASAQPDYVNGVALFTGEWEPHALLEQLHGIEAEAGRVRGEVNAARTLDIDLLAMGDLIVAEPSLTLPHPRLHGRAFVLLPLMDVAPGWVHPLRGRTAASLLDDVDRSGVARLA